MRRSKHSGALSMWQSLFLDAGALYGESSMFMSISCNCSSRKILKAEITEMWEILRHSAEDRSAIETTKVQKTVKIPVRLLPFTGSVRSALTLVPVSHEEKADCHENTDRI